MNNIATVIQNLNQTVGNLSRGLSDLDKTVRELDRKFQILERMPNTQPLDTVKRDDFMKETNELKGLIVGLSNDVNTKISNIEKSVSLINACQCANIPVNYFKDMGNISQSLPSITSVSNPQEVAPRPPETPSIPDIPLPISDVIEIPPISIEDDITMTVRGSDNTVTNTKKKAPVKKGKKKVTLEDQTVDS